jgi:hypothetical protein
MAAAYRCNEDVVAEIQRRIAGLQRTLGRCALDNLAATDPVPCTTTLASTLAAEAAAVDGRLTACADTAGLAGCRFVEEPDPACLGATTTAVATALVQAVFAGE